MSPAAPVTSTGVPAGTVTPPGPATRSSRSEMTRVSAAGQSMPNAGSSQRHSAGGLGHVLVRHLVEHLGVVLERLVALRESLGTSAIRAVLGGQLDTEPAHSVGESGAKVDHHEVRSSRA